MRWPIWNYFFLCTTFIYFGFTWGFFAHRHINALAIFALPPQMIGFYKEHINYLAEHAVDPDRRRYAVEGEAPRHYIDMDLYVGSDSNFQVVPMYWSNAVDKYGTDSLEAMGIVPWHVYRMYFRLQKAFLLRDPEKILRTSAELGHYVSDANVPLHTTSNYDGQFTGQTGLHALWESRLPELFFDEYDFFVGRASYISNVQRSAWHAVEEAHRAVDSVFRFEKQLQKKLGNKKYNFETRGRRTVKTVSLRYASRYHKMLDGMVERQMRASVKMISDLWYTAWVDAGQPDLELLIGYKPTAEELEKREEALQKWRIGSIQSRAHEQGVE